MKILILIFFFEIKESKITRGHNYTLVKKQSRLDVRKYSFSQRTINVWNNLSTDGVHASSVNMFKNKIDKYLVKAGYTLVCNITAVMSFIFCFDSFLSPIVSLMYAALLHRLYIILKMQI